MSSNPLRNIPSVSELLESPPIKRLVDRVSSNTLLTRVRGALDDLRGELQSAASEIKFPNVAELAERIASRILAADDPSLRPVVNATGVLLHPGLGGAPLADEAVAEMAGAARDYASVDFDLAAGRAAKRSHVVEPLLLELTGAEAALVLNSASAAMTLTLAALAAGRECVVSRRHVVELDDGQRLTTLATAAGATLREVGATNHTTLDDYSAALADRTGVLLAVHSSSFSVSGPATELPLAELIELGRSRNTPVAYDLGLGGLIDLAPYGLVGEPVTPTVVRQGVDVVLLHGAGLLGGPSCGILLGRRATLTHIAEHPLAASLRADKLTLAALAATLRLYQDPPLARRSIPVVSLLATPIENLKLRAERLAPQIAACGKVKTASAVEHTATLTGQTVAGQQIATWGVAIAPGGITAEQLAGRLRTGRPAVVGRVVEDRLFLDLRTVFPRQDQDLVTAVASLA